MTRISAVALVVTMAWPLFGEGPAEQFAQTTATQRIHFAPGGTIHWNNSYGDLYIEGWDRPEVEVTVIKSTSYDERELAKKNSGRPETVGVTAERRSDMDIEITTAHSHNKVKMEYRIRVPRDSRLVVDHRGGTVLAANVTGDIDVANRDGDIMLMLPEKGAYAIDARSKMGHIASDFDGKTLSRYLLGQRFIGTGPAAAHRIHLRTGFGGITILALASEGEALSSADGELAGGAK